MEKEKTFTIAFLEEPSDIPRNQVLPGQSRVQNLKMRAIEVSKEAVSKSLKKFVLDMNDLLDDLPTTPKANVSEITLTVQVTADGGIQWLASASSGISGSMTLKFEVKQASEE